MKASYTDLIRHSAVYGVGQVLSRIASVILLPIYTRYLTPADYGVIAILDLAAGVLGILVGVGLANAVQRFHFRTEEGSERNQLWWTGLATVAALALLMTVPVLVFRQPLSQLLLGPEIASAALFLVLATGNFFTRVLEELLTVHLRVDKRSTLLVATNLARLALNIALNLLLLIRFDMGVAGVLWGNLLTGIVTVVWLLMLFVRKQDRPSFDWNWLKPLAEFGGPMVVTALLGLGMHRGDRFLLRIFLDLDQVGLYSVAYSIGQAVNTLILLPFTQIWRVVIFELEGQENAKLVYVTVFRYFFDFLALSLFAVSVFAAPILRVLVAEQFFPAASLIPIVCLAYLFFSLNVHFNTPALLANKTTRLILPSAVALLVNVAFNLFLIPRMGAAGAAWASVLTFMTLSFAGLAVYRRIDRYPYSFTHSFLVLLGLMLSYLMLDRWFDWSEDPVTAAVARLMVTLTWALILVWPLLRSGQLSAILGALKPGRDSQTGE